ncbi:MAG: bifunctional 4-hydroxy-2-oxoglutarate aldolase/2-dehydro-3-deoxy-phosphogluconate aldolase [Desulfobulbaceae bacterium]
MKLDMPVIGILRGIDADFFGEVLAMSFANGLQAIEVTINTSGAEEMVSRYRGEVPPGNLLGMGTVRDLEEARRAVDAGAMFLVTPNLEPKVIEFANRRDIPIIAGALTPTEVYGAWRAGADMVKVFPCGALGGPRYIRELRGPFGQIPLAAVGGVSLDNLGDYFAAGARAVGVSTSLFGREALRNRDIDRIGKHVKKFIEQCPVNG